MNSLQVQFLMSFFEDRMWTILSENTNKYVHAKLRQAKDNGDKDSPPTRGDFPFLSQKSVLKNYL